MKMELIKIKGEVYSGVCFSHSDGFYDIYLTKKEAIAGGVEKNELFKLSEFKKTFFKDKNARMIYFNWTNEVKRNVSTKIANRDDLNENDIEYIKD